MSELVGSSVADTPLGVGAAGGGVKSARRVIELVNAFVTTDSALSLSDLHASTGIPRSSLHGLIHTLLDAGWLRAEAGGTRYRLGVRALICGTAYLDHDPVMPYATEALEEVRDTTGFTAHYARRDGAQVVYLETRESRQSVHLISRVGRTLPVHATALGKALLAELTDAEINGLLERELPPMTPNTLRTPDQVRAACASVRGRGYAMESEEGTLGVRCVAAVVPYRIPATDAMSCSMRCELVSDAEVSRVGELLAQTASSLGERLRRAGIR